MNLMIKNTIRYVKGCNQTNKYAGVAKDLLDEPLLSDDTIYMDQKNVSRWSHWNWAKTH